MGNLYDAKDTLLKIVVDDSIDVTGVIDPRDAPYVEIGQRMMVNFPYSDRSEAAKVKSIVREVDPRGLGKVTLGASIPNHDHQLKAGMFVNLQLELGPAPDRRARPSLPCLGNPARAWKSG